MSERAGYSRVYWTIVDDPKFVTIFDHDGHLAAWLRMLMIADQSHPASAHLPSNVKRASVLALSEAGIIDLQANHRYRIHGLDAERERRRIAATSRGTRPTRTVTERYPDGSYVGPLDETRRDEDETRRVDARESLAGYDGRADLEAFVLAKGRPPTPKQRRYLDSVLAVHDLTGPQWAADLILAHPDDPIGAVMEADRHWRHERLEEAKVQGRKAAQPPRRRASGLTGINAELAGLMRDAEAKRGAA